MAEVSPDETAAAAAMAGGRQEMDSGVASSAMELSGQALAHNEEQRMQNSIGNNNNSHDTDGCVVHGEAQDKVVKGAKNKRGTISLEKKKGKKKKSAKNKREDPSNAGRNRDEVADPDQFITFNAASVGGNSTIPNSANDVHGQSSTMVAPLTQEVYANATMPHFDLYGGSSIMSIPYIQGGYTSLILGVDQAATLQPPARKLHFDPVPNHKNM